MKTSLLAVLIAMLIIFAVSSAKKDADLLVITPDSGGSPAVLSMIDELNENKFMITYICASNLSLKASGNYDVKIKGTNYSLPFILGYKMESGGYFTYEMQKNNRNAAVLNNKAAFDIFGGKSVTGNEITFNGNKYIVEGVIDDDGDDATVYVPATLMDATPTEYICRLDENLDISAEYVKNELKYIGITEDKFTFVNNAQIIKNIKNNFFCALQFSLFCLIALYINKTAKRLKRFYAQTKIKMEGMYLKEFFNSNKRLCFTAAIDCTVIAAGFYLMLFIATMLLEKLLLLAETFEFCRGNSYFIISLSLLIIFAIIALFATIRALFVKDINDMVD